MPVFFLDCVWGGEDDKTKSINKKKIYLLLTIRNEEKIQSCLTPT